MYNLSSVGRTCVCSVYNLSSVGRTRVCAVYNLGSVHNLRVFAYCSLPLFFLQMFSTRPKALLFYIEWLALRVNFYGFHSPRLWLWVHTGNDAYLALQWLFWSRVSLCNIGWPGAHYACVCLPSAEMEDVRLHSILRGSWGFEFRASGLVANILLSIILSP